MPWLLLLPGCEILDGIERARARNLLHSLRTCAVVLTVVLVLGLALRFYDLLARRRAALLAYGALALVGLLFATCAGAEAPQRMPTQIPYAAAPYGAAGLLFWLAVDRFTAGRGPAARGGSLTCLGGLLLAWFLAFWPRASGGVVDAVAPGGWMGCVRYARGGAFCWGLVSRRLIPVDLPADARAAALGRDGLCFLQERRLLCARDGAFEVVPTAGVPTALAWGPRHLVMVTGERLVQQGGEASRCLDRRIGAVSQVVLRSGPGFAGDEGCVLRPDASVSCWTDERWDDERAREVLDPAAEQRHVSVWIECPVFRRPELRGTRALAAGERHLCALSEAGEVRCWGLNSDGQIGQPTGGKLQWEPTLLQAAPRFDRLVAGERSSCARSASDHAVSCWGAGFGPAPRRLAELGPADELYQSGACVCARNDGALRCLGGCTQGFETLESLRATAGEVPHPPTSVPRQIF